MKPGDYEHVRLILRGRAAGGITQADVQRRARELSLLRTGSENYTAEDIEDAERELMLGGDPAAMADDAETSGSASRDPGDPSAAIGGMDDPVEPTDEMTPPEKLAEQGVEEAQRDQMIAAHRQTAHTRDHQPVRMAGHKTPRKRKRGEH